MIFRVMVRPKRSFFRRRTPTVSVENLIFKKYSHFFGVFEESNDTLEYFVEIRDDLIWWEEKAVISSISQLPCPWEWNTFFVVHPVFRGSTSKKKSHLQSKSSDFFIKVSPRDENPETRGSSLIPGIENPRINQTLKKRQNGSLGNFVFLCLCKSRKIH